MHVTSNTQNDTHELEGIVHHFEEIIKTLSRQIISLEKEMCSIKKSMLVKSAFKCEECNTMLDLKQSLSATLLPNISIYPKP